MFKCRQLQLALAWITCNFVLRPKLTAKWFRFFFFFVSLIAINTITKHTNVLRKCRLRSCTSTLIFIRCVIRRNRIHRIFRSCTQWTPSRRRVKALTLPGTTCWIVQIWCPLPVCQSAVNLLLWDACHCHFNKSTNKLSVSVSVSVCEVKNSKSTNPYTIAIKGRRRQRWMLVWYCRQYRTNGKRTQVYIHWRTNDERWVFKFYLLNCFSQHKQPALIRHNNILLFGWIYTAFVPYRGCEVARRRRRRWRGERCWSNQKA